MKAVKNIAARGTPVVCTIHQPSATLFAMFTHLLLLKKGGYTTYFGPIGDRPGDCSVMLDYFAGALGREIKPFQNPAEFILEVTGSGTHTRHDHHAIPPEAHQTSAFTSHHITAAHFGGL